MGHEDKQNRIRFHFTSLVLQFLAVAGTKGCVMLYALIQFQEVWMWKMVSWINFEVFTLCFGSLGPSSSVLHHYMQFISLTLPHIWHDHVTKIQKTKPNQKKTNVMFVGFLLFHHHISCPIGFLLFLEILWAAALHTST